MIVLEVFIIMIIDHLNRLMMIGRFLRNNKNE